MESANMHNEHYEKCVIQPIIVIKKFLGQAEYIGYLKGNILKYRLRAGYKGVEKDDIDKALVYEKWLRDEYEKH